MLKPPTHKCCLIFVNVANEKDMFERKWNDEALAITLVIEPLQRICHDHLDIVSSLWAFIPEWAMRMWQGIHLRGV